MITNAILLFICNTLYSLFTAVLPVAEPNANFVTSIAWVYAQSYKFEWLVPVTTLLQAFIVLLVFFTIVGLVMGVRYVVNVVRGAGA